MQEALLAAAQHWPADGRPDNPRGWLIQVASRRLTDQIRSEQARRRREEPRRDGGPPASPQTPASDTDDTLMLLFLCCHPDLTPASAIALTLRAVGGLTDRRDRRGLPGAGSDDGAAHQPCQGADPVVR